MQGLSIVEKPNRDFYHQLQDVGQTGLMTVNGNAGWTSGRKNEINECGACSVLSMGMLAIYILSAADTYLLC